MGEFMINKNVIILGMLLGGIVSPACSTQFNVINKIGNAYQTTKQNLFLSAAQRGNLVILKQCLKHGISIDYQDASGVTALFKAAYYNKKNVVEWCLKQGASVDLVDNQGRTALMCAIDNDNYEIAQLLIKHGSLDVKDSLGKSALIHAFESPNGLYHQIVKALLVHKASVNQPDDQNKTPLMYAIEKMDPSKACVSLLLEAGADVNAQNNEGTTALMLAVELERSDVVRLLLLRGAFLETTNNQGQTALTIAANINNIYVKKAIENDLAMISTLDESIDMENIIEYPASIYKIFALRLLNQGNLSKLFKFIDQYSYKLPVYGEDYILTNLYAFIKDWQNNQLPVNVAYDILLEKDLDRARRAPSVYSLYSYAQKHNKKLERAIYNWALAFSSFSKSLPIEIAHAISTF